MKNRCGLLKNKYVEETSSPNRPTGFRAGGEAVDLDKLSTPSHTALSQARQRSMVLLKCL